MFKNVHYNNRKGVMHVWEQVDGEDLYDQVQWVPYVYVASSDTSSKTLTIDGKPVVRKGFSNYFDYAEFCKTNMTYEDNVKPEIQFLAERYHNIPDDELVAPSLKVYSIDIEVHTEDSDPLHGWKPESADCKVVLISIHDMSSNKTTTFGLHPYTGKYSKEKFLDYIQCKSEEVLLLNFFNFMNRTSPDVITGWNISQYDLPYLINRIKNLFGEESNIYNKLSPIGTVRMWEREKMYNIDIAGVHILDYIDLYKWYSPNRIENYRLETVAQYELEKGKVDYSEYKDLRTLYKENWDLYVTYNIIDALRVSQLEEKLGYIKQVQSLSLLTRVPMKFFRMVTNLLEGLFLVHLKRNNLCAPHLYGGSQEGYEGAYVKEPQRGLHGWLTSWDITSSYPTAIITLNMSLETYFGRILNMTEESVIERTKKRNFPDFEMMKEGIGRVRMSGKKLETFNKALEKRLLCIAPCGSVFATKPNGIMSNVEHNLFLQRIEIRNKMTKLKKTLLELRGDNLIKTKEKINQLNNLQNAYKTMLNSMYGGLAVPYSRWFNKNIAEAITSCGRHTMHMGEKIINQIIDEYLRDKSTQSIINSIDTLL